MTRIRFYHNAEDPPRLACELITKAWRGGRKVAVRLADSAALQQLDRMLWALEPRDFIPHVELDSALARETPIVLASAETPQSWPHHDVLFNLADSPPQDLERFRMLVEIVGQRERDKQPARERWQQYRRGGYAPEAYDAITRTAL